MKTTEKTSERDYFNIIRELTKTLRAFQSDAAICEDITLTQFSILDYINEYNTLEMSQLHKLLAVEKSTTTRLIQPLLKKDLISKIQSHEDMRVYNLQLTNKGISTHEKTWKCIADFLQNMVQSIPNDKQDEVTKNVIIFIRSMSNCCGINDLATNNGCCS